VALQQGDTKAAVVLYENRHPMLVRWEPRGYQETSFEKLSTWLHQQQVVEPGTWVMPGPTKLHRRGADEYLLYTIYPPETRVIPVNYLNPEVWKAFVDRVIEPSDGDEGRLVYVRARIPSTLWVSVVHWPRTGPMSFEVDGTKAFALSRTKFKHFGIGNVNQSGNICWGTRLVTMGNLPSLDAVRDLFYSSPFNMDLQTHRFTWTPDYLPTMVDGHLRRNPRLTEIPARCFAGRSRRGMGTPANWILSPNLGV
jgi:hypothetical protein